MEPLIETITGDVTTSDFIAFSFDPVTRKSSGKPLRQKSEHYKLDVVSSRGFGDILLGDDFCRRRVRRKENVNALVREPYRNHQVSQLCIK